MVLSYSEAYTSYRAIQLPFSLNTQGKVASTTVPGKVWADRVLSAVGTTLGERVMRPSYGTNVGNMEFASSSEVEAVFRQDIESAFATFLTSLRLENVTFDFDESRGIVYADVSYFLPNKDEQNITMGIARISGAEPIISQEKK